MFLILSSLTFGQVIDVFWIIYLHYTETERHEIKKYGCVLKKRIPTYRETGDGMISPEVSQAISDDRRTTHPPVVYDVDPRVLISGTRKLADDLGRRDEREEQRETVNRWRDSLSRLKRNLFWINYLDALGHLQPRTL